MIASALSLFNIMVIVSRLANMMQQPFTGSLIDNAPKENTLEFVEAQYRILIGASTLGTVFGIILLPSFIALFCTILAQALFIWGAKYIAWFTKFIV